MRLDNLRTDEDAVSPVIGVILMVAITVILSAVIGTFVLGMTDQFGTSPPQTTLGFEYENGTDTGVTACDLSSAGSGGDGMVRISHDGGDGIEADAVEVVTDDGRTQWADCSDENETIRAGDTAEVDVDSNATLRVVWYAQDGDGSSTLRTWRGSDY